MTAGQVEPSARAARGQVCSDRLQDLRRQSARAEADAIRAVARADADWLLECVGQIRRMPAGGVPAGGSSRILSGLAAARQEFELDLDLEPLIRAVRDDLTRLLDESRADGDPTAVAESLSALARACDERCSPAGDLRRRGLAWLAARPSGGDLSTVPSGAPSDVPGIIACYRALRDPLAVEASGREAAARTLAALLARQGSAGAWPDATGEASAHVTGLALSVILGEGDSRHSGPAREAAPACESALAWLFQHQERSGAWRRSSNSRVDAHPRVGERPRSPVGEGWIGLGDVAATRAAVHGAMRVVAVWAWPSSASEGAVERSEMLRSIEAGLAWWLAARGERGWPAIVGEDADCDETAAALELLVALAHWRAELPAQLGTDR